MSTQKPSSKPQTGSAETTTESTPECPKCAQRVLTLRLMDVLMQGLVKANEVQTAEIKDLKDMVEIKEEAARREKEIHANTKLELLRVTSDRSEARSEVTMLKDRCSKNHHVHEMEVRELHDQLFAERRKAGVFMGIVIIETVSIVFCLLNKLG